jgi:hypothetical protein
MTTAQVILLAMIGAVFAAVALRELLFNRLSASAYEHFTVILVMASLGLTIAGLDGLAHA